MAKKATTFMKEDGEGWIEVKRGKVVWLTRKMMVMDGYQDFSLPPGRYIYDKDDNMVKPHTNGHFPKWKEAIPKRKGYHKAQVESEDNMLKILERGSSESTRRPSGAIGKRDFPISK